MRASLFLVLLLLIPNAFAAPKIQSWETANGAHVLYVHAGELPMIDVQVVFDAGSARDGEKYGTALLTNGLLSEGTARWNADEIAERFDSVGAQFSNTSRRDMSMLTLRSLTDPAWMDKAVETFSEIITAPKFPKDAFERERKRVLIALQQQKESPDAIADEIFFAKLYAGHPYAVQPEGTEASVAALTTEDLRSFYQRYFVGKNAVVAIVGDVSQEQAKVLAEKIVGGLPAGVAAAPLPQPAAAIAADEVKIDFPATQTHIQAGQVLLSYGDPDFFPMFVGNHILGGSGLVSRISDEIREKRGLAYSAYSYFVPMRQQGPFIMGLQTKNDQAEDALKVLRQTLADFIAKGPTAKELEASKKNITGGFALRIDANSKIVSQLSTLAFYDMPLDYLDTFISQINAVTAAQVKDVFARRLNPEKMTVVKVGGDAEKPVKAK